MNAQTIGTYELGELLGEGGIGRVYAAQDQVLGRRVAIKRLRPEFSQDSNFVERFYVEAKSLANLNHTNITTLHALHAEGGEAFMVMELVEGCTLDALLKKAQRLTLRDSLAVLAQAVPGLRYAHRRGIIHRDIKPANMMITNDGTLKIMDFGIARVRGSQHLTQVGEFCGTYLYASPEQIRGGEVDERSDLYSLAIVFYRMLAGEPPFTSENEYALMTAQLQQPPPPLVGRVPDLDERTEAVLMRALAKQPDDRFASVEEFGRAVGAMALRGESAEILQQLQARVFGVDDLEKTRVVTARRTPTGHEASSRSEWKLPDPAASTGRGAPSTSGFSLGAVTPAPPPAAPLSRPEPAIHARPIGRRWLVAAIPLALLLVGGVLYALASGPGKRLLAGEPSRPAPAIADTRVAAAPAAPPAAAQTDAVKPASPAPAAEPPPPPVVAKPAAEAPPPLPAPPGSAESPRAATPASAPATPLPAAPTPRAAESATSPSGTTTSPSPPPAATTTSPTTTAAAEPPPAPPAANAAAKAAANPAPAEPPPPATAAPAAKPADQVTTTDAVRPAAPPAVPATTGPPTPPPAQVASAETHAAPNPPPAGGPPPTAAAEQPEGPPDLEGHVTGLKGLAELEIDKKKWIKIYGIVDRVRGAREQQQHTKALVSYLRPSHNHLVCYHRPGNTYRCYSDGKDIARLALADHLVQLAPDAPEEYRSLRRAAGR